jgi:rfaE bifunctional protein nucleotidyltransferase chain/domain
MRHKIKSFNQVLKITNNLKKEGKKIVFVHGFFDILHAGHLQLLLEAKKLGDVLIVGVDHDDNAKILKGPNRPINNHAVRMFVLSNIEHVDFVFLIPSVKGKKFDAFSDFYVGEIYQTLRPHFIVSNIKSGQYDKLKKKDAKKIGAKFVNIPYRYGLSTTKIIKALGLD